MAKGEDQDYPLGKEREPARHQAPANEPQPDLEPEDEITLSPPGSEPRALTYKTGKVVGNDYILEELLGRGGMGVVFAARHRFIDQKYAVKILAPELLTERNWLRFQREAQSLAKLNHESIVRIFNMGIDKESCPYYVMEFLKGETLAERLSRLGPMSVEEALDCFGAIASALQAAHKQQIIHRDIKPSNIILLSDPESRAGRYKLVDFGLARVLTDSNNRLITLHSERDRQSLTEIGEVFGSPYYMSPEQCRGESLDQRTDIYSFGCSFYEALTGKVPLRGATVLQTFMMHQSMEPVPLNSAYPSGEFSEDLELAVSRMLAKNSANRYQDVEALLHDFQRLKSGKTIIPQSATSIVSEQKYLPAAGVQSSDEDIAGSGVAERRLAGPIFQLLITTVLGVWLICTFLTRFSPVADKASEKSTLPKSNSSSLNLGSLTNPDNVSTKPLIRKPGPGKSIYLTIPIGYNSIEIRDSLRKSVYFEADKPTLVNPPLVLWFSLSKDSPEFLQSFNATDIFAIDVENFNFEVHLVRMRALLKGWTVLRSLCFKESSLNGETLDWISELPNLNNLELSRCRIAASSFASSRCLRRLHALKLRRLVEDDGKKVQFQTDLLLSVLDRASELHNLELDKLSFSSDGLRKICGHRNLERLLVFGHRWTVNELKMLAQAKQIGFIQIDFRDLGAPARQYLLSLSPAIGTECARFVVLNRPGETAADSYQDSVKKEFDANPPKYVPSF